MIAPHSPNCTGAAAEHRRYCRPTCCYPELTELSLKLLHTLKSSTDATVLVLSSSPIFENGSDQLGRRAVHRCLCESNRTWQTSRLWPCAGPSNDPQQAHTPHPNDICNQRYIPCIARRASLSTWLTREGRMCRQYM